MLCVLTEMYEKQLELDNEIASNHDISYEETKDKRLLALIVELGEFANATRTFKFWSFKPSESKSRVLDEFADGLHFLLSIGLAYNFKIDSLEIESNEKELTEAILSSYHYINEFYNDSSYINYIKMFEGYLKILATLGYSWQDAYNAYFTKLKENHHRQETNY